jgi:hypothetical protein
VLRECSHNHTDDFLIYSDLKSNTGEGFPVQHSLTKPANFPSLSGGFLWSDEVNKCFYQFGGAYPAGATIREFGMSTYDVISNQWNTTKIVNLQRDWQRPALGAGTQAEDRGFGFYYGGWISNRTVPSWQGPPVASNSIFRFDYTTGILTNDTRPDKIGRAEGQMVFLPISDGGVLIYFGGVEDSNRNGSYNAVSIDSVHSQDKH